MQAVILAAGRGVRLKPLTDKIPKSLVEINGVSLIINDLEALSKYEEIKEVIVVVGYKKDLIKNKIGNNYKRLRIKYVENDEWESTNNIYSLWLATNFIKEDFILMEGDIFFKHDILDYIFQNRDKNIAFLSKYDYNMSGTVVEIDEKNKKIKRLIPIGEQGINFDYSNKYKTVNIYYFTQDFYKKYFKPNLDLYIKTHGKKSYYEINGISCYRADVSG